jgi:hypothetical protein
MIFKLRIYYKARWFNVTFVISKFQRGLRGPATCSQKLKKSKAASAPKKTYVSKVMLILILLIIEITDCV